MSEGQKLPRKPGSPLSLRQLIPAGWREERPAFAGDPFFDWESQPEPPRERRLLEVPQRGRSTQA